MTPRLLYHLARADFLERVRRTSFLITLGVTLYAAYMFLPSIHASYVTVRMGNHRGLYNSAWVGAVVSILTTVFLSLAGFYLVKNAVDRDRRTGVGQILATTPLGRAQYLLGKTLSNFAVLVTIVALVALAAGAMQIVRGEDLHLHPGALLAPFVFLTLPTMLMVAGIAVLFECLPGLGGSLGNVVFFFLWIATIAAPTASIESQRVIVDPMGLGLLMPRMIEAVAARFPDFAAHRDQVSMGFTVHQAGWHLETFVWPGLSWSASMLAQRMAWVALGIAFPLVGVATFDRFDTSRVRAARRTKARGRGRRGADARDPASLAGDDTAPLPDAASESRAPVRATLTAPATRSFSFVTLLRAEVRLALKGLPWWWTVVELGLVIACALVPSDAVRCRLLAIAWMWPLTIWSAMGSREVRYQTAGFLFSAPRPVSWQLPAVWLAGVFVAIVTGIGAGARFAATGEWTLFGAWLVGALFVPSMALALGVWTGGGKLFEVLFLILWYGGPMSGAAPLDFTGVSPDAIRSGAPLTFLVLTVLLLAAAVAGRARVTGREG